MASRGLVRVHKSVIIMVIVNVLVSGILHMVILHRWQMSLPLILHTADEVLNCLFYQFLPKSQIISVGTIFL